MAYQTFRCVRLKQMEEEPPDPLTCLEVSGSGGSKQQFYQQVAFGEDTNRGVGFQNKPNPINLIHPSPINHFNQFFSRRYFGQIAYFYTIKKDA